MFKTFAIVFTGLVLCSLGILFTAHDDAPGPEPSKSSRPAELRKSTPASRPFRRGTDHSPSSDLSEGERRLRGLDSAITSLDGAEFQATVLECLRRDPELTSRWLLDCGIEEGREDILRAVATDWARRSPKEAFQWALECGDGFERQFLLERVCMVWAETNAQEAISWVEKNPVAEPKIDMIGNLVGQWASRDLFGASYWVMQQSPGELRDQLVQVIALRKAAFLPAEAARLVLKEIPPGPKQNEAVIAVLHQWGQRDLFGASAWANRFPRNTDLGARVRREIEGIGGNL